MENKKGKKSFIFQILVVTIFINWVIPKAGIKVKEIPLTLGIVFFIMLLFFWLLSKIKIKISFNNVFGIIIFSIFYYILRFIYAFNCESLQLGEIFGYGIPLMIFPLIYIVIYNEVNTYEKYDQIMKILTFGYYILTVYSILQAIFGIEKVTIPGITVNLTDYKTFGNQWFLTKSNGITVESAKIVSTYQNGNMFGVNLILFFPIIFEDLLKNKQKNKAVIALVLFIITELLTLSRTCWVGVVIFVIFRFIFKENKNIKAILMKMTSLVILIFVFYIVLQKVPSVSSRLLNTDFETFTKASGRTEGAVTFLKSSFEEGNPIINLLFGPWGLIEKRGLAYEMIEIAIFKVSGIIGLSFWIAILMLILINVKRNKMTSSSGYEIAIIMWLIVSFIDGAYWAPPTALNLFTLLGLASANIRINREDKEKEKV